MDGQQLIWIVVAIVVIAVVIAIVVFGRRAKTAADRKRAAQLREQARTDALGAHERRAEAARAEADAHRAESEAERLHNEAMKKQKDSERANEVSQDRLRRAAALDPDGGDSPGRRNEAPDRRESSPDRRDDEGDGESRRDPRP
ncbi:hypothetical protein GCM10023063_22390 [Arthrobacter methylotrophus]|uniref:Uncharacterized protein n=1 Tax=Arthrobacter methylotrophus TaxID=121291 RepID=A0ABV5UVS2_9MICC